MASSAQIFHLYELETTFEGDNVTHTTHHHSTETERWRRKNYIGEGGYGVVWLEEEAGGRLRAVKQLPKRAGGINWSRELNTLAKLKDQHTFFVEFLGWYRNENSIFLAMEYIRHGDLAQYLRESGPIAEPEAEVILRQLLGGLVVLHKLGICHRDLKPQNVLVASTSPIRVKIADFGLSKLADDTSLRTNCGTTLYKAPELLGLLSKGSSQVSYTNSVDIWSLGIIVHQMLTSIIPFSSAPALNSNIASGFSLSASASAGRQSLEPAQPMLDFGSLYEYCNGHKGFPSKDLQDHGVSRKLKALVVKLLAADPRARIAAVAALSFLENQQTLAQEEMPTEPVLQIPETNNVLVEAAAAATRPQLDPGPGSGSSSGSSTSASGAKDPEIAVHLEHLSTLIRKNGFQRCFPSPQIVTPYAERAARMCNELTSLGCKRELAMNLEMLTLYDLAILVDSSDFVSLDNGVDHLQDVLTFVSDIYSLAQEEQEQGQGVTTMRFTNCRKSFTNVTTEAIKTIFETHDFGGPARVGVELKKKILDTLCWAKPRKLDSPERIFGAGAAYDFILSHPLYEQGLVDIGDISDRLGGLAQQSYSQGPVFKESDILEAIHNSRKDIPAEKPLLVMTVMHGAIDGERKNMLQTVLTNFLDGLRVRGKLGSVQFQFVLTGRDQTAEDMFSAPTSQEGLKTYVNYTTVPRGFKNSKDIWNMACRIFLGPVLSTEKGELDDLYSKYKYEGNE